MRRIGLSLVAAGVLLALAGRAGAGVEHPFILWTAKEAARARKLHESCEWARRKLDELAREDKGKTFLDLYRCQVLGDQILVNGKQTPCRVSEGFLTVGTKP